MKKITLFLSLVTIFFLGGNDISLGGELIDAHNWEKVKDILPHKTILEDIKKGLYTINIVSAKPMKVPKYFDELTRKNVGIAKLTPKGHLPNNLYKGGTPFPQIDPKDPQAGTKIFWNWAWKWQGDDYIGEFDRYCFDKTNRRVNAAIAVGFMRAVGRGKIPPTPSIPGAEHITTYWLNISTYPRDVRGTVTLAIRYDKPDKYDDVWRFFPTVRRVRRLPSTERYAALPPSIFIMDDTMGFSGKITHFTYRLLGEEKILSPVHVPPPPYKFKIRPGYPFPLDLPWELRDCWVVEQKPRPEIYPKYAYSKRIFRIDKEVWTDLGCQMFDRKGEYWKEYIGTLSEYTLENDEKGWYIHGNTGAVDLLTGHKTTSLVTRQLMDCGFTRKHFGIGKLLEFSRMGRMRP